MFSALIEILISKILKLHLLSVDLIGLDYAWQSAFMHSINTKPVRFQDTEQNIWHQSSPIICLLFSQNHTKRLNYFWRNFSDIHLVKPFKVKPSSVGFPLSLANLFDWNVVPSYFSLTETVITSTKEVMFLDTFVCPSVSVHDNSKSNTQILKIFFMWVAPGEMIKWLNFGKDVNHVLDTKKNSHIFEGPTNYIFQGF